MIKNIVGYINCLSIVLPNTFIVILNLLLSYQCNFLINNDYRRSGCLYHNLGFRSVYQYREERTLYLGFAPPEAEITAFQVTNVFFVT